MEIAALRFLNKQRECAWYHRAVIPFVGSGWWKQRKELICSMYLSKHPPPPHPLYNIQYSLYYIYPYRLRFKSLRNCRMNACTRTQKNGGMCYFLPQEGERIARFSVRLCYLAFNFQGFRGNGSGCLSMSCPVSSFLRILLYHFYEFSKTLTFEVQQSTSIFFILYFLYDVSYFRIYFYPPPPPFVPPNPAWQFPSRSSPLRRKSQTATSLWAPSCPSLTTVCNDKRP